MTGMIDQDGKVGAIGGVVEKAYSWNKSGKTLLLLPRENKPARPLLGTGPGRKRLLGCPASPRED
ncbi:hypothetical protein DSECCO2_445710 [anaerobic digester metagenome]